MADTVRLRHTTRSGNWAMYFYEGELPVRDSIIEIPASRPEWVKRAWIQGFRMTVAGRVVVNLDAHVRAELARDEEPVGDACCSDECCQPETEEAALACCSEGDDCCAVDDTDCACAAVTPVEPEAETETAESGEETTDEGPADRGQSPDDDGVRSSEPTGDGSLPEGGVDGRGGDEPADGGAGDQPAD